MPYQNEVASKTGHGDIIKNPDISEFLEHCEYMDDASEDLGKKIASLYEKIELADKLPEKIIASDASRYCEPINGKFPSTQIGYVKVSLMIIEVNEYNSLKDMAGFVDPFGVAKLHKNAEPLSFVLPGSNVRYKKASSVNDGFRLAIYENFISNKYNFYKAGDYNIKDTLFFLHEQDNKLLSIHKCPACKHDIKHTFTKEQDKINCKECGTDIFFSDALRLHEQISDFGDNNSAITRFMNLIEHLLVAGFIRFLYDKAPERLSNLAFILDGPLAIFGQPARVHSRLMKFYNSIMKDLKNRYTMPIIIGLQKTGSLNEHANSIKNFLEPNSYKIVDDEYRKKYIFGTENSDNFGHETYYGQDFIYKSKKGSVFVFAIPYPYDQKCDGHIFSNQKIKIENYAEILPRALKIIEHFEMELYENSITPIALAHRHASISLVPGGKALDLLSKNIIECKK